MARFRKDPPPDELRQMIYYHDGELYWFPEYRGTHYLRTDRPLGTIMNSGYKAVRLKIGDEARHYLIHRLIWWLLYDEWPEVLDHIDRNRLNNCASNLRKANGLTNGANKGISICNTSGFTGVSKLRNSWRFALTSNGVTYCEFGYKTKEAAALARDIMAHLINGEYAALNILDNPTLSVN